jgi:hypothetical protein
MSSSIESSGQTATEAVGTLINIIKDSSPQVKTAVAGLTVMGMTMGVTLVKLVKVLGNSPQVK